MRGEDGSWAIVICVYMLLGEGVDFDGKPDADESYGKGWGVTEAVGSHVCVLTAFMGLERLGRSSSYFSDKLLLCKVPGMKCNQVIDDCLLCRVLWCGGGGF